MNKALKPYVEDILKSIQIIQERTSKISYSQFKKDGEKHESITFRIAIIGEAVNRLNKHIPLSKKYPEIDWKGIISMRNFLIHEYDDIDLSVIWQTIQKELSPLKTSCEKILEDLN